MLKRELFSKLPQKIDRQSKVLILTHTDADGAVAAVILSIIFPNSVVKHCSNAVMSSEIRNAVINSDIACEYDYIFACDISCNEDDAIEIDESDNKIKLILIDHHPTSLALNKYEWACVEPKIVSDSFRVRYYEEYDKTDLGHSSGTSLVFDYMDHIGLIDNVKNISLLKNIVHLVAAYDTWDWMYVFEGNPTFDRFRKLCDLYGIELFEKTLIERLSNPKEHALFTATDNLLLEIEDKKIEKYLEQIEKSFVRAMMRINNINEGKVLYNTVYCFTNDYLQETFKKMAEFDPNADLYIINYGTGISLRTTKSEINIGKIAKLYDGGGHPGAGGFKIPSNKQSKYMSDAMNASILENYILPST